MIIRVDRLRWAIDGYVVEWNSNGFVCSCGAKNCVHKRALWNYLKERGLVVYVKELPKANVIPKSRYIDLGDKYILFSTRPYLKYIEATPNGLTARAARGRPVPLYVLSEMAATVES